MPLSSQDNRRTIGNFSNKKKSAPFSLPITPDQFAFFTFLNAVNFAKASEEKAQDLEFRSTGANKFKKQLEDGAIIDLRDEKKEIIEENPAPIINFLTPPEEFSLEAKRTLIGGALGLVPALIELSATSSDLPLSASTLSTTSKQSFKREAEDLFSNSIIAPHATEITQIFNKTSEKPTKLQQSKDQIYPKSSTTKEASAFDFSKISNMEDNAFDFSKITNQELLNFLKSNYDIDNDKIRTVRDFDFSGADLSGLNIDNLRFVNCNLSGCKMPSTSNVIFEYCNLSRTDWSNTKQTNLDIGGFNSSYKNRRLLSTIPNDLSKLPEAHHQDLHEQIITKIQKIEKDRDEIKTDLTDANFQNCEIVTSMLTNGNFLGANFLGAKLRINTDSFSIKGSENLDLTKIHSYSELDNLYNKENGILEGGLIKINTDQIAEKYRSLYGEDYLQKLSITSEFWDYTAEELYKKLQENKKIIVRIDKINEEELLKTDHFLPTKETDLKRMEELMVNYANTLFRGQNIEFVGSDYEGEFDHLLRVGGGLHDSALNHLNFNQAKISISIPDSVKIDDKKSIVNHELLHVVSNGLYFGGVHPFINEDPYRIGEVTTFSSDLSYSRVIYIKDEDNQLLKIELNKSPLSTDLKPLDYHSNKLILDSIGRRSEAQSSASESAENINLNCKIENLDLVENSMRFQQRDAGKNILEISENALDPKKLKQISIHKARDLIKYCEMPSLSKTCSASTVFANDDLVVLFKKINNSGKEINSLMILSGGQKEIILGNTKYSSEQIPAEGGLKIFQSTPKSTPKLEPKATPAPQTTSEILETTPPPNQDSQNKTGLEQKTSSTPELKAKATPAPQTTSEILETTPPPNQDSQDKTRLAIIAGSIMGGLAVIAGTAFYCHRNRQNLQNTNDRGDLENQIAPNPTTIQATLLDATLGFPRPIEPAQSLSSVVISNPKAKSADKDQSVSK